MGVLIALTVPVSMHLVARNATSVPMQKNAQNFPLDNGKMWYNIGCGNHIRKPKTLCRWLALGNLICLPQAQVTDKEFLIMNIKRPNKLDWLIYSIFRTWWNPILRKCPRLRKGIMESFQKWDEEAGIRYYIKSDDEQFSGVPSRGRGGSGLLRGINPRILRSPCTTAGQSCPDVCPKCGSSLLYLQDKIVCGNGYCNYETRPGCPAWALYDSPIGQTST